MGLQNVLFHEAGPHQPIQEHGSPASSGIRLVESGGPDTNLKMTIRTE
ncbi:hypothetical protein ACPOL_0800 [Acidisarcina polymorpha]|uniref:Uncharacterized protein n=1 Tax=Acidisarcina polymorpha TaxID=2211140 RepID=A0A2Z5FTJ9_9BACT|nr:hypothetical protein ACPOL_0800 [Acidisarcina polymorpha]